MSAAVDISLPKCAKCKTYISKMVDWHDQAKCVHVVVFHCHGERERVELTHRDLQAMDHGFAWGECFVGEAARLPAIAESSNA